MLEQFAGFQNGFNWYYIKKDDVKSSDGMVCCRVVLKRLASQPYFAD